MRSCQQVPIYTPEVPNQGDEHMLMGTVDCWGQQQRQQLMLPATRSMMHGSSAMHGAMLHGHAAADDANGQQQQQLMCTDAASLRSYATSAVDLDQYLSIPHGSAPSSAPPVPGAPSLMSLVEQHDSAAYAAPASGGAAATAAYGGSIPAAMQPHGQEEEEPAAVAAAAASSMVSSLMRAPSVAGRDRAAAARKALQAKGARVTSQFRGVTHHVRTRRWESHIWIGGKQVYLGGFDSEEQAALAYDIAAIKVRGPQAHTNFAVEQYGQELEHLGEVSVEELILSLRKQSRGPRAKASSAYRGVTRHAKGKWEARIGHMSAKKYKYLGLYESEMEAARAYDIEAVRCKGLAAITNFDIGLYTEHMSEQDREQYSQEVAQGLRPNASGISPHPTSSQAGGLLLPPPALGWAAAAAMAGASIDTGAGAAAATAAASACSGGELIVVGNAGGIGSGRQCAGGAGASSGARRRRGGAADMQPACRRRRQRRAWDRRRSGDDDGECDDEDELLATLIGSDGRDGDELAGLTSDDAGEGGGVEAAPGLLAAGRMAGGGGRGRGRRGGAAGSAAGSAAGGTDRIKRARAVRPDNDGSVHTTTAIATGGIHSSPAGPEMLAAAGAAAVDMVSSDTSIVFTAPHTVATAATAPTVQTVRSRLGPQLLQHTASDTYLSRKDSGLSDARSACMPKRAAAGAAAAAAVATAAGGSAIDTATGTAYPNMLHSVQARGIGAGGSLSAAAVAAVASAQAAGDVPGALDPVLPDGGHDDADADDDAFLMWWLEPQRLSAASMGVGGSDGVGLTCAPRLDPTCTPSLAPDNSRSLIRTHTQDSLVSSYESWLAAQLAGPDTLAGGEVTWQDLRGHSCGWNAHTATFDPVQNLALSYSTPQLRESTTTPSALPVSNPAFQVPPAATASGAVQQHHMPWMDLEAVAAQAEATAAWARQQLQHQRQQLKSEPDQAWRGSASYDFNQKLSTPGHAPFTTAAGVRDGAGSAGLWGDPSQTNFGLHVGFNDHHACDDGHWIRDEPPRMLHSGPLHALVGGVNGEPLWPGAAATPASASVTCISTGTGIVSGRGSGNGSGSGSCSPANVPGYLADPAAAVAAAAVPTGGLLMTAAADDDESAPAGGRLQLARANNNAAEDVMMHEPPGGRCSSNGR